MSDRHATRDAVLTYLRVAGEPRPLWLIVKYMRQMHRVKPGTTREMLRKQKLLGTVQNPSWGFWEIAPPAKLDTMPATLTTHYQE